MCPVNRRFATIRNEAGEELDVMFPPYWWFARSYKIKWKGQEWKIVKSTLTSPVPYLSW